MLTDGDHYLVASRGGTTKTYYQNNKYYVEDNLNYKLTIKPKNETDVTIYNKRREKFRVEVPKAFTMDNITIDSLDSILYSHDTAETDPECLSE